MHNYTLNIFYEEPDPDRWVKYDRFFRKLIRRVIRGKHRPGGQMMVAVNLMKGLDKLGINYRFNDYKYSQKNPTELVCVIGKSHLIFKKKFKNPILFGASVFSHPIDCPDIFEKYQNLKKIIVPGSWMKDMFAQHYGIDKLISWPVGIDTDEWNPSIKSEELDIDFLIYDKIRWHYDKYQEEIINPIVTYLEKNGFSFTVVKYGAYNPSDLKLKLARSKSVIFICEHETQGLAYQQILSTNTPIFAWDRGGYWQDAAYFPDKVKYEGNVSSVPYWSEQCGIKFKDIPEFYDSIEIFLDKLNSNAFNPREYILKNLTLEKAAEEFYHIATNIHGNELSQNKNRS